LLVLLAELARLQGEYDVAWRYAEEALAIRRSMGVRLRTASPLSHLGMIALARGHWAEARTLLEEADAIDREHGNRVGGAPNALGHVALKMGNLEEARRILESDLAIKRELGLQFLVAADLHGLGDLYLQKGEYQAAFLYANESLAIRRGFRHSLSTAGSLELLAAIAAAQGQARRGARLLAAAEGLREALGTPLPPVERPDVERCVAAARAALGEAEFAAAWAEGRAMSLEEAVALALAEDA
jgi:tetratricopeptide (TPR) repeat protein